MPSGSGMRASNNRLFQSMAPTQWTFGFISLDFILPHPFKLSFGSPADRAYPVIWYFCKRCARFYVAIGVTFFRVINITTNPALVFRHFGCCLLFLLVSLLVYGKGLPLSLCLTLLMISLLNIYIANPIRKIKNPNISESISNSQISRGVSRKVISPTPIMINVATVYLPNFPTNFFTTALLVYGKGLPPIGRVVNLWVLYSLNSLLNRSSVLANCVTRCVMVLGTSSAFLSSGSILNQILLK